MAVVRSARWLPLLVVALALLAAGPMADVLVQPVLQAVPPAGRILPGGTIGISVSLDGMQGDGAPLACLDLRIEPGSDDDLPGPGRWQYVCPRFVSEVVLLPPRAEGVLLVEWNGTVERVPFLVPAGAHVQTYVHVGPEGLQAPGGLLQDWDRVGGGLPWVGLVQAVAFLGFLGLCILRGRLAWMTGLLAIVSLTWIPLAAKGFPRLSGWLVMASWAVLLVAAFARVPDDRRPRPSPPHGEPLDEAASGDG